jgi:hypothetical protein
MVEEAFCETDIMVEKTNRRPPKHRHTDVNSSSMFDVRRKFGKVSSLSRASRKALLCQRIFEKRSFFVAILESASKWSNGCVFFG